MTSFLNADGSSLTGAMTPGGIGQALKVDGLGNLLVSAGVTNQNLITNGQAFSASTGMLNSGAGTNNYALSIFNPAGSGKTVLIYSIQVANGSGAMTALLQRVTSDPAFSAVTPLNARAGGGVSALAGHVTQATSNQPLSGTYDQVVIVVGATLEILSNGAAILLPGGSNNGLVQYIQTYSAAINSILMRWIEF